ncbi:MAG: hypothetical protein Q4A74_08965, partial [Cardiobacteriaceae bacterium]|nr:hypothetical protein [Cardiobacteriaceae bacterium]
MAAITSDGTILQEEDPEKLLQLPATLAGEMSNNLFQTALEENIQQRKQNLLKQINERNLGYFEQEVKKLEDWADDL